MNTDFMDDIGRTISGAVDTVSRKTGEVVEITKLKNQVYNLEREIKRDYARIGMLVYARYAESGDTDEDFLSLCEEIAEKEALKTEYEGEISELKKGV